MYWPNGMSDFFTLLSSHVSSTRLCRTSWYYFFPLIRPQISFLPKHASSSLILQSTNLLLFFIMSHSPSSASTIHPDTLGLPPEPLDPPLQGLADKQGHLVELQRSSLPVPALASRLADEVLPPLKKGASTDQSTGLQAIFPVPVLTRESQPAADELLPPLKKGASTDHFTGLQAIFPVSTLASRPAAGEVLPPLKREPAPAIPLAFRLFFRSWRRLERADQPMRCCLP
jgi:hypothetical protein